MSNVVSSPGRPAGAPARAWAVLVIGGRRRLRASRHWLVVLAVAHAVAASPAAAQEPRPVAAGRKTTGATRTSNPIVVDGALDEDAWSLAEPVDDFVQQEPTINAPVSEATVVRVLVDEGSIYFGITCEDRAPTGIIARELRRDNALAADDRFEIILDTFHDHRNGFHFVINPLGTQFDALVTDEGQDVNTDWNERWWSSAQITDRGWTAEIRIPFSTLRSARQVDTWGVNFKRFIRRKNEIAQWTAWDRDFSFLQVSQAGHLTGLAEVRTGLRLRVKPYALGGLQRAASSGATDTTRLTDVGLEVMRFSLTPGLTAELTANTDFAQTEVDDAIVNLTRFPLFFPEKREFFLERAGIFEFGLGGRRGGEFERNLQMFYSRRIGISEDRQPVPILGGGKITGRAAGFDVGFLNVQTDDRAGTPGSNYTVLRAKRNILARSNTGIFVANRQSSAAHDHNRVFGGDANFTFLKNTDVQGFVAKSWTPGRTGNDYAGRAKFNWFSDLYELFAEHLVIGPEFQHDIGFLQRRDIQRSNAVAVWEPRLRVLNLRNAVFRGEIRYLTDIGRSLVARERIFQSAWRWQTDEVIRVNSTDTLDRLTDRFEIAPGVVIPPGDYGFREQWVQFEGSPKRLLAGLMRYRWGDFYTGRRRGFQVQPAFRPFPMLSFEATYELNDVDLPQGAFRTHVLNARVNFNLSNRWLTTSLVQYDSASARQVLFFRLNYIYRPGDNLFVVLNRGTGTTSLRGPADYALMVKLTRSFDF